VNTAMERIEANGYIAELVLVNVSRSRDIAGLTRLEPLNPVFILTAYRSSAEVGKRKKR